MWMMNPEQLFKFCPKCGGKFKSQSENVLVCSLCKFHFYINPAPCNTVIIENDKGEIMLVKRKKDPKKGYWDLPGGFVSPGETLTASAKREIKEELGVEIEIIKILEGYHDTYLYEDLNMPTLGIVLVAKIISGEPKPADDITEYKFFTKDEVLQIEQAFPSVYQALKDYTKGIHN